MNDEYRTLLVDAYKGEVFGEALFGEYAQRETGDRAEKLRTLGRIEGDTASRLQSLVDDAGIDVPAADLETMRAQGREMGAASMQWDDFVKGLHDALPPFLASFVQLRTLATDQQDPALVALIAHEQAINAFAELELAGNADRSLAVLRWHLDSVA